MSDSFPPTDPRYYAPLPDGVVCPCCAALLAQKRADVLARLATLRENAALSVDQIPDDKEREQVQEIFVSAVTNIAKILN